MGVGEKEGVRALSEQKDCLGRAKGIEKDEPDARHSWSQ